MLRASSTEKSRKKGLFYPIQEKVSALLLNTPNILPETYLRGKKTKSLALASRRMAMGKSRRGF